MRILDLFCGAGGAAMGLHQAFPDAEIWGIDINKQSRYPFKFIWGDALEYLDSFNRMEPYDFIWASPPCQRYSAGAGKWGTQGNHPHLIEVVRDKIHPLAVPYVIENIVPARKWLCHSILLCGTQFGLGVFRHRLFEASFFVAGRSHMRHAGAIGDGKFHTVTGHAGGSSKRDGWKNGGTSEWRIAMGIDWMVGNELAQAIPPAYSKYIAEQFKASEGDRFEANDLSGWEGGFAENH